jgi:hypothetical protein
MSLASELVASLARMEKIMSKTDDTSQLATLEDQGTFADTELDAATGGMLYLVAPQNSLSPQVFRDHSSPSQFHVLIGP